MGWGRGSPSLTVHEQLSYGRIKELLECGDRAWGRRPKRGEHKGELLIYNGRSNNYALRERRYEHPLKEGKPYELAMCVRLYRTDVLRFFRDGTVVVNDWDSSVTRYMTSRLGPIDTFKSYRRETRFHQAQRWRPHGKGWEDPSYPMDSSIVVHPDGFVRGMVDRCTRVRAEAKPERARIAKKFRHAAFARLALGEFPYAITRDEQSGLWLARVPAYEDSKRVLFSLLETEMNHASIAPYFLPGKSEEITSYSFGRKRYHQRLGYQTETDAAKTIIRVLLRVRLDSSDDYETYETPYAPIQTR